MGDFIAQWIAGPYAVWMLIGFVALLHFQIERREPVKGEWLWLGAIIPIMLAATALCSILSQFNRLLRGENPFASGSKEA